MTMATRIVVMKDGLIQQVDTPQNLYDSPCNKFVAGFIGTPQMNFIDGRLEKKGEDTYFVFDRVTEVNMKPQVEPVLVKLPADKASNPVLKDYIDKEIVAGIRPECIHDDPANIAMFADAVVDTDVEVTELMGAEIYLYLKVGDEAKLTARVSSRSTSRAGDKIQVAFDASRIHLFDKDTEKCLVH
jgi:multiple sugar transport system ATP-binding protein